MITVPHLWCAASSKHLPDAIRSHRRDVLHGAQVVVLALGDPAVAAAWDAPAVLEDQLVSGLAGHLARGGVWVVADYLDAGIPGRQVDFTSAAQYFSTMASNASADDHRTVRARGAEVAMAGREELLRTLELRLEALGSRLRSTPVSRTLAVAGGKVMRLDDYLATRIVEQVVYLDDLARSVNVDPWTLPVGASDLVIEVGLEVARQQAGSAALLRGLYRRGFAEAVFPVL